LASLVVEEVAKLAGTHCFFFYLRDRDPERESFLCMARSLISQALRVDDSLIHFLYDEATTATVPFLNNDELASRLLELSLKQVGKAHVVIDGIDEAPEGEQRQIVKWLMHFVEQSRSTPEPTRCVFFSQDDSLTKSLFSSLPTLRMVPQDNEGDINAFCTKWSADIGKRFRLEDLKVQDLCNRTAAAADGNTMIITLYLISWLTI
jgi:hypothetical protein